MAQAFQTGPFIQSVTTPNNNIYYFKDAKARNDIENIKTTVTGAMYYVGISSTPITDGSTSGTITVDSVQHTFGSGDAGAVAIYGEKEFVWNGTKWQEFGSTGSLKALAFKDNASGSTTYTPAGSVTKPTFTGSTFNSTGSFTPAGSVTVSTANKNTTVSTASGTATYTPAGSVTVSTANKTATVSTASGTATYTPEGSVTAPTISVSTAGATTTIKNPTAVSVTTSVVAAAPGATAPSNNLTYYSVSGENLSLYQIGYGTGNSITTSNVTVKTGDASYSASTPSFSGTGVRLVTGNIAVTTAASFSGTGARLLTGNIAVTTAASFSGTSGTVTVNGTPAGDVSQPTFEGTQATISVTVS